jgi:hypothetical protein
MNYCLGIPYRDLRISRRPILAYINKGFKRFKTLNDAYNYILTLYNTGIL